MPLRSSYCDVAPQRLRDLVARPRLLFDQPVDLLGAPSVQGEALVNERAVVGDRVAVAREQELHVHLARGLKRAQVGHERLRPLARPVGRPRDQRVRRRGRSTVTSVCDGSCL
jgi:hypothetical protein